MTVSKRFSVGLGILVAMILLICILAFKGMADMDGRIGTIGNLAADRDTSLQQLLDCVATAAEENRKGRIILILGGLLSIASGIAVSLLLTKSLSGILAHVTDMKERVKSLVRAGAGLSESAEQISRISEVQAGQAGLAETSFFEISKKVEELSDKADDVGESVVRTIKDMRDGEALVARTVVEVREIAAGINGSAHIVRSLGERSEHIGEIVEMINEVADRTNLLSLNAAIEAARAGEEGKGLAAVADELRHLSEKTTLALGRIGIMVKAVQGEVERAFAVMNDAAEKIESGSRLSVETGQTLNAVIKGMEELQSLVLHVISMADDLNAASDRIGLHMGSLAQSARDGLSGTAEAGTALREVARLTAELQKNGDRSA